MATAELATIEVPQPPVEEEVVVLTLTKHEAALLLALSGYIETYPGQSLDKELYALLKVAGKPFGMTYYSHGETHIGTRIKRGTLIKFDGPGA